MGEHFQHVAAPDVARADAAAIAQTVTRWLQHRQIIALELTDCVLSEAGGYGPGDNAALALSPDDNVPDLWTNGLEIKVGPTVFYTAYGPTAFTCPACGATEPEDFFDVIVQAVDAWMLDEAAGALACPACSVETSLKAWRYDEGWAFADFGLVFWNWPPLAASFLQKLEAVIGSTLVLGDGKL